MGKKGRTLFTACFACIGMHSPLIFFTGICSAGYTIFPDGSLWGELKNK